MSIVTIDIVSESDFITIFIFIINFKKENIYSLRLY